MMEDLFANIPKDIIEIIFLDCDVDDLGKLSRCCKRLNNLIEREERWKVRSVRLWDGIFDYPSSALIWAKETSNTMSWKEITICLWRKEEENGWSSKEEKIHGQLKVYFGKFSNGKKITDTKTFQISTYLQPQVYFGEFVADGNGEGTRVWMDGDYRKGTFQSWYLHGNGEEKRDDYIYRGEYAEGLRNGYGVATWDDGSKYEGQWKCAYKYGQGKMEWTKGLSYDGYWKNDKPVGPDGEPIDVSRLIHPDAKECIDKGMCTRVLKSSNIPQNLYHCQNCSVRHCGSCSKHGCKHCKMKMFKIKWDTDQGCEWTLEQCPTEDNTIN
eukprot:TRINITY_DN3064_c1_g5_i1.p1 TRINITY_DN3064_c1_g5~~TRINITY_DN3064_c1_g5_i1.p1  ORF type:complete len:326 (+),score=58.13 TRINITY_DN3064_c1_g5_i1:189-1166(+)